MYLSRKVDTKNIIFVIVFMKMDMNRISVNYVFSKVDTGNIFSQYLFSKVDTDWQKTEKFGIMAHLRVRKI